MRHVFGTMGTSASLETSGSAAGVEGIFPEFDERFSLYRASSELSRVAAGALDLTDTGPELRAAYARAIEWRALTDGAFTPHRPDGVVDLSGIVKALAMEAAGALLGPSDWCLNVGGDVLVSGAPVTVGIVDPADRGRLLTSVLAGPGAVATSGSAERGDHIWGGDAFVQVTVVAADVVTADVLATAIVAGGRTMLDAATSRWAVDVLAIDRAGTLLATPGFTTAMRAAAEGQTGRPYAGFCPGAQGTIDGHLSTMYVAAHL